MLLLWVLLAISMHVHAQITVFSNIGSPSLIFNSNIPYTISSAGRYIIAENISYNASSATPAITVNANNVIIDFIGRTVAQIGGFAGVSGISLASGVSNVSISNGVISDFSQSAITAAAGVTELAIDSMSIKDCGNRGIELVGTIASPIVRSKLLNCNFQTTCTLTTADNVLTLSNVTESIVNNCRIISNGSSVITGTLCIVHTTNTQRCIIQGVHTHFNTGNFDIRGFSLNNSCHNLIRDCKVNTFIAAGNGSSCRGFSAESSTTSTGNIFDNCIAQALTGSLAVDGFFSGTGCDDNLFQNCISELNTANASNGAVHGFRAINNNRTTFRQCFAYRNVAPNSTIGSPFYGAYGFKVDSTTATLIHQCLANEQSASTRAVGIFLFQSTNCSVTENTANHNTFGFDANSLVFNNNAFSKNFASKNTGATQYTGFGANAANDSIAAGSIAINTTVALGPVSWSNVGIT